MALDYCNYVFTSVFILESISKIIALGPYRYFKEKYEIKKEFIRDFICMYQF
jgi:hypothetical protein